MSSLLCVGSAWAGVAPSLLLWAAQSQTQSAEPAQTAPEPQQAAPVQPQAPGQPAPPIDESAAPQDEESVPIETRLATLFEGALADSKNGEPFAETPGYAKLLSSLAAYAPAEVTQLADADLDHAGVMADPDRFRGEFVRVRGLIAYIEAHRLDRPVLGAVDVYRGVVTKADGSEGVWFDMLEPPPAVDLEEDVVDIEGVFYRTVRYENRKGQEQQAPWLIVRNFTRPEPESLPRTGPSSPIKYVLIGAVLAYLGGRLIVFLRQQSKQRTRSEPREGTSIRQMMLDQRGKRDRESPRPPRS